MKTIDEITVNYEEDGVLRVKELEKAFLSKGAWVTAMFTYQDWNESRKEYGPVKATIRRYRKIQGIYRMQNKFNISSARQARKMIEILEGWFPPEKKKRGRKKKTAK